MIYLDSSNIKEIGRFRSYGIIDGVTSNPSIMLKDGVTDVKLSIKELIKAVSPLHLSIEVMTNNEPEMIKQAVEFSKMSESIVVKIPVHGPNGELENLRVIHTLFKKGIKTNVTCCMSAFQCLLAAKAGASYVSLFGGRVSDTGYNVIDEISDIKQFLNNEIRNRKTFLIIGSVREPANVLDWLAAGADIVTVPPPILEKMLIHPGTKEVVRTFLEDAKRINNGK